MRLLLHTIFILLTGRRGHFLGRVPDHHVIIICPAAETLLGGFLPQFLLCRIVSTSGLRTYCGHSLAALAWVQSWLPPSAQELRANFLVEDEPQQVLGAPAAQAPLALIRDGFAGADWRLRLLVFEGHFSAKICGNICR